MIIGRNQNQNAYFLFPPTLLFFLALNSSLVFVSHSYNNIRNKICYEKKLFELKGIKVILYQLLSPSSRKSYIENLTNIKSFPCRQMR